MRNVRQFFRATGPVAVQKVVKLLHAHRSVRYPDKDGGRHRDEGLDFSQRHFKRLGLAASLCQALDDTVLTSLQQARRQDGEVGSKMGQFRMQFPTEFLDELTDRIPYVSHQGITRTRHDRRAIITRRQSRPCVNALLPGPNPWCRRWQKYPQAPKVLALALARAWIVAIFGSPVCTPLQCLSCFVWNECASSKSNTKSPGCRKGPTLGTSPFPWRRPGW